MKQFLKAIRISLATLLVLVISQVTVFASTGNNETSNALSAAQVVGGFAVLVFLIVAPLTKTPRTSIQK